MKRYASCLIAVVMFVFAVGTADGAIPPLYKNFTNFNKRYPHGVGKARARDRTSGVPVTNFKHDTRLYPSRDVV